MQLDELRRKAEETKGKAKKHCLRVCMNSGCISAGADKLTKALGKEVTDRGLKDEIDVKPVGCIGQCGAGTLVNVDDDVMYEQVVADHAPQIIDAVQSGTPSKELLSDTNTPFYTCQQKVVLEYCGLIDPESIDDYITAGGYQSLLKAIEEMTPEQVVQEITESGLRGRGGAGFPTGLKWSMMARSEADQKYIICNGDEGDPGAFMDRSVMEGDPHRVLEGMALAGYAVGASKGYIYVRAEYPLAMKRLKLAIRAATKAGLMGPAIGDSDFSFEIEVRLGAGAFVCGEETALIASVEGKRGQPRPRPPYPAERGLWGKPTLINNVETLANIRTIIDKGAAWYAGIGTEKSKGTKVFALAGKVNITGLIEVPMGLTLREIVMDIGGGVPDGKAFKAVQTGGPSGGCIPAEHLDMPVDYESLAKLGSIMGSGGLIVMDETSDMVDVARFFMEFCQSESCGKCVPCRVGTAQMHDLLAKIIDGQANARDLALLEDLCDMVRSTSLCGLGMTAPNPVLSTLQYFRNEYEERLATDAFAPSNGNGQPAEVKA